MSKSRLLGAVALCLIAGRQEAMALLVRADYNNVSSPNYTRYFNLAYQNQYQGVGQLTVTGAGIQGRCTGTMLSATIVLTAAHCLYDGSGAALYNTATNQALAGGQITFALGNVTSMTAGVPQSITYSAPVDAVGVYSGYRLDAGLTPGIVDPVGDIAILRLNTSAPTVFAASAAPTTFLPIYTGNGELANPPNIATVVGYGQRGDGVAGASPSSTGVKQAGLVLLDSPTNTAGASVSVDKLSAQFYRPSAFGQAAVCTITPCTANDPRLLPSNFLQAGIASGDSGGPLLMNIANAATGTLTNSIIGVASYTNGSTYGSRDVWTRVSTYAGWIASEILTLAAAPPGLSAGTNITNPFAPTQITTLAGAIVQRFTNFVTSTLGYFFDPPASKVIEINAASGPAFASIFVPSTLGTTVELWRYDPATLQYYDTGIAIATGSWYDFDTSLTRFELISSAFSGSGSEVLGFKFISDGEVDFSTSTFLSADNGTGGSGGSTGGGDPAVLAEPPGPLVIMLTFLSFLLVSKIKRCVSTTLVRARVTMGV